MKKLLLFIIPFLSLFFTHCSPERPEVKTTYSEEELNELLNQKKYSEIIQILEPRNPNQEINATDTLFLIYAHLGRADFKILGFASKILGKQKEENVLPLVVFPSCPNKEITLHEEGLNPKCIIKRFLFNLPDTDSPHYIRAQELFRKNFSEAKNQSNEVNFLGGILELTSAFSVLKKILIHAYNVSDNTENKKFTINSQLPVTTLAYQFQVHIEWSLKRAKNTYHRINHWIIGLKDTKLLQENNASSVDFVTESLLPEIIHEIAALEETTDEEVMKLLLQDFIGTFNEE